MSDIIMTQNAWNSTGNYRDFIKQTDADGISRKDADEFFDDFNRVIAAYGGAGVSRGITIPPILKIILPVLFAAIVTACVFLVILPGLK